MVDLGIGVGRCLGWIFLAQGGWGGFVGEDRFLHGKIPGVGIRDSNECGDYYRAPMCSPLCVDVLS